MDKALPSGGRDWGFKSPPDRLVFSFLLLFVSFLCTGFAFD